MYKSDKDGPFVARWFSPLAFLRACDAQDIYKGQGSGLFSVPLQVLNIVLKLLVPSLANAMGDFLSHYVYPANLALADTSLHGSDSATAEVALAMQKAYCTNKREQFVATGLRPLASWMCSCCHTSGARWSVSPGDKKR